MSGNSALQRATAGRPPGAANRLSRERANELSKSGETPLDVMIENMLFWHRHSKHIETLLADIAAQKTLKDEDKIAELQKMLRQFLSARENAQKCAVDAAPYMHARLQNVTVQEDPDVQRKVLIEGGLPAKKKP